MTPDGRLNQQPWMAASATRAVIGAMTRRGQIVRFVGGCVRDAVLGRPVKDIDIATPDPPDLVVALLQAAGLKAVPTGIAHGTITAVAEGRPFEVTTLRRDVETFGRHARVEFTDDWAADAARRDLTMNAMFLNPYGAGAEDGAVFDPTGGLADARAGLVRFVGDPEQRILEDYLRILRFFRFHAHYGRTLPDQGGLDACAKHAAGVARLSGERVRNELLKLLMAPAPAAAVELMRGTGVLAVALPEAGASAALAQLATLDREHGVADPVLRLAALAVGDGAAAQRLAGRLRLSNAETEKLVRLLAPPSGTDLTPSVGPRAHRRAFRRLGREMARARILLDWARDGAERGHRAVLELLGSWQGVDFPLKGADVMAAGMPSGSDIGVALAEMEQWWEERDYLPDRVACLAELRRRLGRGKM